MGASGGGAERRGSESGEPRPSLDAIRGEEVEDAAAERPVASDLSGKERGGGAARRRRRRAPAVVREGGRGRGIVPTVLQKRPRFFRNSCFGPSPRVFVDCGFYLRICEFFFLQIGHERLPLVVRSPFDGPDRCTVIL